MWLWEPMASSNNNLNMFEEINLAALYIGSKSGSIAITAMESLKMATVNGAIAIGIIWGY